VFVGGASRISRGCEYLGCEREDVKKVEERLVTRPLTGRQMGSVAASPVDHLLAA